MILGNAYIMCDEIEKLETQCWLKFPVVSLMDLSSRIRYYVPLKGGSVDKFQRQGYGEEDFVVDISTNRKKFSREIRAAFEQATGDILFKLGRID